MSTKTRLYNLAKQLDVSEQFLEKKCQEAGMSSIKNSNTTVSRELEEKIFELFGNKIKKNKQTLKRRRP